MAYLVALYRTSFNDGGPEEGGWTYPAGTLQTILRTASTEASADRIAKRINAWLDRLQRHRPALSSVLYDHIRFEARTYRSTAPAFYPDVRPHYE